MQGLKRCSNKSKSILLKIIAPTLKIFKLYFRNKIFSQQKQIVIMPFVSISDLFHHNFLLCLFRHCNFRFLFQFFFSQFKSLSPFASHDIFDSIQMHLPVTAGSSQKCPKNDNQNMNEFHLW